MAEFTDHDDSAPIAALEESRPAARGFAPGEMITCDACLRANAPTRTTCMYCAATLLGADPQSDQKVVVAEEVSKVLGVEPSEVQMNDPAKPLRKIRALEFSEETITGFPTGSRERLSVPWDQLVLLVTGRLLVNRVEVEQAKSRRNKKPAERRELSSDDIVLDIYTRDRESGWRIGALSFNFSCLGDAKSSLTTENFGKLISAIRERAPEATFDDQYTSVRKTLASIWPVEPKNEAGGWKRAGAGKFSMTTATVMDNEAQFTNYSRLRHRMRLREIEKAK